MTTKSAAQSAKDKLASLAANRPETVATDDDPKTSRPQASPAAPRTKPIRLSVDWLPADYRELTTTCDELAQATGRVSIPAAVLCRAAVQMVIRDPDLHEQLRNELGADRGRL